MVIDNNNNNNNNNSNNRVKTKVIPVNIGATGTIRITQKISKPHTGRAQNQGTTENSHIGHCTHNSESTNVKVQNIQQGK